MQKFQTYDLRTEAQLRQEKPAEQSHAGHRRPSDVYRLLLYARWLRGTSVAINNQQLISYQSIS